MRMNNLKCIWLFSCMMIFWQCDHQVDENNLEDIFSKYGSLLVPSKNPDQIILNLTEDPTRSVAVNWRTDTTISSGWVEVAQATKGPQFREDTKMISAKTTFFQNQYQEEPRVSAHYHNAMINGLMEANTYVYRVGSEESWSEWFQITMPSISSKGLSFIYFGDAQNEVKSMWSRVIRKAYSKLPEVDFMLHAGDLINRADRDLEWGEWFYAGSFIHATIPSVMTPGNHEYRDVVLSPQWRVQFCLPENGPEGLEETCYQINYPNAKVVSLDAEQIDESLIYRDLQANWLDSILTHDARPWTIITLHYPFYSTKPERDNPILRSTFKPILDRHHVDIVLQGHDHGYGRGQVTNEMAGVNYRDREHGTVYVVSVSGPKMYEVEHEANWLQKSGDNTQLFQIISIKGDILDYKAYSAEGQLYDAFQLIKHENQPTELIEKTPSAEVLF